MRSIKTYLLFSVLLAACGGNPSGSDKMAELADLKKQQAALREKITQLEAEIAATDTSGKSNKGKLVAVTELVPATFNHYVEIQARVEGDEDVTLSPETMGNVTSVLVKAGSTVSKGQLLATLDDRIIRQGLDEVNSQLELANQVFDRQKNLWQQRIGSEMQYLQAKTNKEALEKRAASVREQLSMTRIKSPINGTVDQVNIKTGQSVAPGIPVFRVVNMNAMKVVGEVAESYLATIKSGNDVLISFPDLDKEINGKLDYAGKAINRLNRTFNVEVRLNSKDGSFSPNMLAVLKIVDQTVPSALVVPVGSIQKSSEGEFVYIAVVEGKTTVAKRRVVTSGITYNGMTQVAEGLAAGDKVITTGYQGIIEGDIVAQ
jgi:RND family efflux transporter MFP subunit